MKNINRIYHSITTALPKSKKIFIWIIKIIVPTSLFVNLLNYWGVLTVIADFLTPFFLQFGLPGESAIVFISSIFLPLYAPIAILETLPMTMREVTILAVMCLISHNLLVETTIQEKTGANFARIFLTRIIFSFIAAFLLNTILPDHFGGKFETTEALSFPTITEMLQHWSLGTLKLVVKLFFIISALMILQNILKEFHLIDPISRIFTPFMKLMGLSRQSTFLWLIAHLLGLLYGATVTIEAFENDEISEEDISLLNYHVAINHSSIEDTLLFVVIGVPILWLMIPRFILSALLVWGIRGYKHIFEKRRNG